MFQNLQGTRIVLPTENQGLGPLTRFRPRIPGHSDDFFEKYAKTLEEVERFARRAVLEAIPHLLGDLTSKLLELRADLTVLCQPAAIDLVQSSFGDESADQLVHLDYALDVQQIIKQLQARYAYKEDMPRSLLPDILFPLPRKDARHPLGRIFPWAKDAPPARQDEEHHMIVLLRLRDALTGTISQAVVQLISDLNQQVVQELVDLFQRIYSRLNNLGSNKALFNVLLAQTQPEQVDAGNPFARLCACRPPVPRGK